MNQPTSQPAKRTHKDNIEKAIKHQSWFLFVLILTVLTLDLLIFRNNLIWAKSFASGAVLSFTSQYIMAWFSFRYTGYKARQNIVNQLYRGEAFRMLLIVVGFAGIFLFIKPIIAYAVLLGFIIIQLSYIGILIKIK